MKNGKVRGLILFALCMLLFLAKPAMTYAEEISTSENEVSENTISVNASKAETESENTVSEPQMPEVSDNEAISENQAVGLGSYAITYILNGGINDSENPASYAEGSEIVLKAASREYYVFAGWYKDEKLTEKVGKIGEKSRGDITLYAKWKPFKYSIQFVKNGKASGSMAKLTNRSYGKDYTLPKVRFKRKGYAFDGWNTKSDGTGTAYANQAAVKNLSAENNEVIRLYAQWKIVTYSISFEPNGGTVTGELPSSYTVSSDTIELPVPEKNGYVFKGWYKDTGFINKQARIANGSAGDRVLYAKWKAKTYFIHYNLDGGKNNQNNRSKYTANTATFLLKKPKKMGYSFEGWYTDSSFTAPITEITQGSTMDYNLFAKWKLIHYSIAFSENGGQGTLDEIICEGAKKYKLPICGFVRNGYYCTGWNTSADGRGKAYGFGTIVRAISSKDGEVITLYAMWEKFSSSDIDMANEVVNIVNAERAKEGLPKLTADPELMAIAQQRAKETTVLWSHTRPDNTDCFTIYGTADYNCGWMGENIAEGYTSPGSVMEGWMNSPGHRANILQKGFGRIGVGCICYEGRYYWVQNFSD